MMRFTLKQILAVATIASLAVPALLYAGPVIAGFAQLSVLLCFGALVTRAALLRGPGQWFAIGFVVFFSTYAAALYSTKGLGTPAPQRIGSEGSSFGREFSQSNGRMITTQAVQPILDRLHKNGAWWYQLASGEWTRNPGQKAIARSVLVPSTGDFMAVAHCLWSVLFGYLGGWYAVWIGARSRAYPGAGVS